MSPPPPFKFVSTPLSKVVIWIRKDLLLPYMFSILLYLFSIHISLPVVFVFNFKYKFDWIFIFIHFDILFIFFKIINDTYHLEKLTMNIWKTLFDFILNNSFYHYYCINVFFIDILHCIRWFSVKLQIVHNVHWEMLYSFIC